jgi:glycerol kinase
MDPQYILALDQGTTSSRSILFGHDGTAVASRAEEFPQTYPQPGWVEHDPIAIWESQLQTAQRLLRETKTPSEAIAAIGITNQRETTVLWDRATGAPLHNAIVWQCRRTAEYCDSLRAEGFDDEIQKRTGLILDAYFSGTKLKWLLDTIPGARERATRGELCFGTIDTWLLYNLTGEHATDPSNASRTLLYNIHEHAWDDTTLDKLDIPHEVLPEVRPTSGVFGTTQLFDGDIPVAGLCGDQQSALFGQAAFAPGECKNTYGTGCFLLMNTGDKAVPSKHGLLTTVAWQLGDAVTYATEGSVFIGGAVIQWLRDELGLLADATESEAIAASAPDTDGVYIVPAFVGLGAPYWDPHARGTIVGLTRGASRAHLVRAALESISFQSADVLRAMQADTGKPIPNLRVDGGASQNNVLMQHQADVLGIPVVRGKTVETTALGAAYLAGLATGFWKDQASLYSLWQEDRTFEPQWSADKRATALEAWDRAIATARSYAH